MSYSEAVTKEDLLKILDSVGYAKDDWTIPNVTNAFGDQSEHTTTGQAPSGGYTLVEANHKTNTGRFVIFTRAVIKTSRYTSNTVVLKDGAVINSIAGTNLTTPITVESFTIINDAEIGRTYNLQLKLSSQDSGTTATSMSYNRPMMFIMDILDSRIKGSRILDCYPVGSYYQTSDGNFNPNTFWGGNWSQVEGAYEEVLLYDGGTGTLSNNAITLSDDSANYDKIVIAFRDNDYVIKSVEVFKPYDHVELTVAHTDVGNNTMYFKTQTRQISGNTIQAAIRANQFYFYKSSGSSGVESAAIGIRKVIGYKKIYFWHRTA